MQESVTFFYVCPLVIITPPPPKEKKIPCSCIVHLGRGLDCNHAHFLHRKNIFLQKQFWNPRYVWFHKFQLTGLILRSNTFISYNRAKDISTTHITAQHRFILSHKVRELELLIITTSNSQRRLLTVVLLFSHVPQSYTSQRSRSFWGAGVTRVRWSPPTLSVACKWAHTFVIVAMAPDAGSNCAPCSLSQDTFAASSTLPSCAIKSSAAILLALRTHAPLELSSVKRMLLGVMTEEQLPELVSSGKVVAEVIDSALLKNQAAPVKWPPTTHQTVGPFPSKTGVVHCPFLYTTHVSAIERPLISTDPA